MDLRHLRYFAAVADTCHFGQAAEQLHVAQPALSYAIRQLEAELDVTLFNRTTRHVSLTPAGEFLQAEAARILAGVDDAERGVRRIAAGRTGLVRLGLTGTAAFSHLPRIARIVRQELPGVALEIQADMLTPAQCRLLRSGGSMSACSGHLQWARTSSCGPSKSNLSYLWCLPIIGWPSSRWCP